MKTIIFLTILLISLPAFAQPMPDTSRIAAQIAAVYPELKGWCRQAIHDPRKGGIVIYYHHDKDGVCRPHFKQGPK